MPQAITHNLPYIAVFNFFLVCMILIVLAVISSKDGFEEVPGERQNIAEFCLDWFFDKARETGVSSTKTIVAFLAMFFYSILLCNLLLILPLPPFNIPPTSYYSGPLALALCSIFGTIIVSGAYRGTLNAIKHLFWPNPLQLISEAGHILSLSLRLFGNIGGEYAVIIQVLKVAPYGIPVVIHLIGLIPVFIQAFVFTLLTSTFVAGAVHHEETKTSKA